MTNMKVLMSSQSQVSPGGVVSLKGEGINGKPVEFTLHVAKLSTAGEIGLRDALLALARQRQEPAAHFLRMRRHLEALRKAGMTAEWQSLADMCAAQTFDESVSQAEYDKARRSPKGVALELHARTRAAHPETTLAEFEAVVTLVNAPEVHERVVRAVTDDTKSDGPPDAGVVPGGVG